MKTKLATFFIAAIMSLFSAPFLARVAATPQPAIGGQSNRFVTDENFRFGGRGATFLTIRSTGVRVPQGTLVFAPLKKKTVTVNKEKPGRTETKEKGMTK
jgi:hypothetical protein